MKNIYDLEGNYWEWTAEAGDTYRRTLRGDGYYNGGGSYWTPASDRGSGGPTGTLGRYSARPALYVNL